MLTQEEVEAFLSEMQGVNRLMAQIIYGGGLRHRECLGLRIKDLYMARKTVVIRSGKGEKDRESNQPGAALPGALEKKWPNAGKEWAWIWVFPSERLSTDPRSNMIRRHHVHKSVLHKHQFLMKAFK